MLFETYEICEEIYVLADIILFFPIVHNFRNYYGCRSSFI